MRRVCASWCWSARSSHDRKGRPPDHYLPLILNAIQRLVEEKQLTPAAARRYAADRLLGLLPLSRAVPAFGLPPRLLTDATLTPEQTHARARASLVARLKAAATG